MNIPAGLEFKTAVLDRPTVDQPADVVSSVNPLGIVTALVAVTGVRDHVGDVIPAGAFARTLREREAHPRLLHDWHRPVGNTLGLRELPPGHAELPRRAPDGRPWPRGAGALIARYRIDLSTKDGRRALAWAQGKLGARPWYSIGYVPVRTRRVNGSRYLDDLELWEYSLVHRPANDLAFQVDVKDLSSLVGSEHQPPASIEVKVRYVRDSGYWGYPVGTPITDAMKPRGATAIRLRRAGRVPTRTVGATATKPAEGARSTPVKLERDEPAGLFPEPDVDTRVRASAAATGDIEGAVVSLIAELEDSHGDLDRAIPGLLHEGETPAELAEDLRANESWSASGAERDDLIESVLVDYRAAYRARAAQQVAHRGAAAAWEPPSQEAFDRIAGSASTALESFEEGSLATALAALGHDDPVGFAAHLLGEDTPSKKAGTELDAFIAGQRERTESSGDIGERLGDLSQRDDQDLLDFRRTVAGELATDDETTIAAAETAINAEIERRGLIAIGDVKPGDVFDFDDQRYYVASDGSLVDPEGERANLPRTAYRTRAATLVERDASTPPRAVDTEQLASSAAHVVADAPAGRLEPAAFARERQRADARRTRATNIAGEQERADQEVGYAAAADALADTAPAQLDLAALQTRRQLIMTTSERRRPIELAAGGRLAVVGVGSKGWSVVTGSGMQLVHAASFTEAKPPSKRTMADLANRLASLADARGRPVPFTATREQQGDADRPDWVRGWRDEQGRSLPEAAASVIGAWADENGLTFRYPAQNYATPLTVPGGVADADGFRTRRADEIAPGDEIRLPDGTIATVERSGQHDSGLGSDQLILADGQMVRISKGIGSQMEVRFAGDPDAVDARQDPGMGAIAGTVGAPPGDPIAIAPDQWEKRWPHDYDRPLTPGTRLVILPPATPSTLHPRDERPRAGVTMARLANYGGHDFQTVRYDDGTYDQLNIDGLRRISGDDPKRPTYVRDPTPDQVNAARAAWGLPDDENAGPGGGAPRPQPRQPFVPTPRPRPAPLTPREQQVNDRIYQGPRAYGKWVRDTATDEELAEEEAILLRMREKMPIAPPSAARAFNQFNRGYVQPVRRERERRVSQPAPESPPGSEPAAELPPPDPDADIGMPRRAGTWRLMFTRQDSQAARDEFARNGWRVRDVREADLESWTRRLEARGWTVHKFPPEPEPPTVAIPAEQLDEAAVLADEVLGVTEQPDGTLEASDEVADRQDRVAALLTDREGGTLDLGQRSVEQLGTDRDDLRAELELQTALERRVSRPKPAPTPGTPRGPAAPDEGPKQRPGLIGAARDHAEALRSGDAEAIIRTRARLESSLRRSRAGSAAARELADHVGDAATENDARQIDDLAQRIKAEAQARRAASARKRRTVRRLERDRIRSLLGEVDAEIGRRGTARFDTELAAIDALGKHRYDDGKRIAAMVTLAKRFDQPGSNEGVYAKRTRKRLQFWLQHGEYEHALTTAEGLEGSDAIEPVPGLRRLILDMQVRDRELNQNLPFPPATGGTAAKRDELHREMLAAVAGIDPEAIGQLGGLSIEPPGRGPKRGDAWYSRWPNGGNRLSVRTEMFDPFMKASRMQMEQTGWFTPTGFDNYLTRSLHHELGHHLHYVAREEGRERQMLAEVAAELGVDAPASSQQPADWVKSHTSALVDRIGTYAGANEMEMVAELWAEYRGRGADASPIAQIVGRHLSTPVTPGSVSPRPPMSPSLVSTSPEGALV